MGNCLFVKSVLNLISYFIEITSSSAFILPSLPLVVILVDDDHHCITLVLSFNFRHLSTATPSPGSGNRTPTGTCPARCRGLCPRFGAGGGAHCQRDVRESPQADTPGLATVSNDSPEHFYFIPHKHSTRSGSAVATVYRERFDPLRVK